MSTEPFVYVGKLPCGVKPGSTVTWASSFTGARAPRVIPADDHVIVTAGYAINGRVVPECQGPGTLTLTPTVTRGYASQTLAPLVLECAGDAPWRVISADGRAYFFITDNVDLAGAAFDSTNIAEWRLDGGEWVGIRLGGVQSNYIAWDWSTDDGLGAAQIHVGTMIICHGGDIYNIALLVITPSTVDWNPLMSVVEFRLLTSDRSRTLFNARVFAADNRDQGMTDAPIDRLCGDPIEPLP